MKVTILCVGKIKEKYLRMAIDEYKKRLGRYCKLEIIEVADEKTKENMSVNECKVIKDKEGSKIAKYIKSNAYIVSLCIEGKQSTSEEMSNWIGQLCTRGHSHIIFIIGGSIGLSDSIINMSNYKLSFSKMTFPHQLMRVILLEQIYRSFKISSGEPYHK